MVDKSWHNLSSAKILLNANHYRDVIAVDLHYSLEKTLKAFSAYENRKISRTHNLLDLYSDCTKYIKLTDEELDLITVATDYHIKESYPAFHRSLPGIKEINEIPNLAHKLFEISCAKLDIDVKDITR